MKRFFVYILATKRDGPLYVGVTSDLHKRVFDHKSRAVPGHTRKYNIDRLVWFELHASAEAAILREKRIKRWKREWKVELIEANNSNWLDLYESLGPD